MIDRTIEDIVDRALDQIAPTREEALALLALEDFSAEASYVRWAAQKLGKQAADGNGLVLAQIGLDGYPCPENCEFCTFAIVNSEWVHDAEVPLDLIVEHAQAFDRAGVHAISLMATAGLPFERFLVIARAVRAAVADDMPLMANVQDLTLDQAKALKEAGIQAAYHANRLGEGEITAIDPDQRRETMRNIKAAGLHLSTGVEPLYEPLSNELILDHIYEALAYDPIMSGACVLSPVSGTIMEDVKPASRARASLVAAVERLIAGTSVPFGMSGGITWVDAGTNPRGRSLPVDNDQLMRDVKHATKGLKGDGWNIPARPPRTWFE